MFTTACYIDPNFTHKFYNTYMGTIAYFDVDKVFNLVPAYEKTSSSFCFVHMCMHVPYIYVQFDGMVYQQIVGISMGNNCAPLRADSFLLCYERDFMSNLPKSKRFDLIDEFNDTSLYLDDIFTIDNPAFAEHIPDIYPRELQLNKAKYF